LERLQLESSIKGKWAKVSCGQAASSFLSIDGRALERIWLFLKRTASATNWAMNYQVTAAAETIEVRQIPGPLLASRYT
jgi:hypothetical protein